MEPQTLSDQVFNRIQNAIITGEIATGAKISEATICEQYGVSRGPLREAIRRLEGRKLLVRVPHAGVRVVSLNPEDLVEIYQLRESLESLACQLAATNMSDDEIGSLGELLQAHKAYIDQKGGKQYYQQEGDWDFHYRIINGSGNQRLTSLLCDELYQLIRLYRFKGQDTGNRAMQAFKEHSQIFDAIAQRDGELAGILMQRHIRASRQNIEAQLIQQ